jgi:hypothetical protein
MSQPYTLGLQEAMMLPMSPFLFTGADSERLTGDTEVSSNSEREEVTDADRHFI